MGKTFAKKENATQNLTNRATQAATPAAWAALLLLKGASETETEHTATKHILCACVCL